MMIRTTITKIKKVWSIAFVHRLSLGADVCNYPSVGKLPYGVPNSVGKSTKASDGDASTPSRKNIWSSFVKSESNGDALDKKKIDVVINEIFGDNSSTSPNETLLIACSNPQNPQGQQPNEPENATTTEFYNDTVLYDRTAKVLPEESNEDYNSSADWTLTKENQPLSREVIMFGDIDSTNVEEYTADKVNTNARYTKVEDDNLPNIGTHPDTLDFCNVVAGTGAVFDKNDEKSSSYTNIYMSTDQPPYSYQGTYNFKDEDQKKGGNKSADKENTDEIYRTIKHDNCLHKTGSNYDLFFNKNVTDPVDSYWNGCYEIVQEKETPFDAKKAIDPSTIQLYSRIKNNSPVNENKSATKSKLMKHTGEELENILFSSPYDHDFIKHSTTTKQEEENKLIQRIENIDESPLVEAEKSKVDGFNIAPKVVGKHDKQTKDNTTVLEKKSEVTNTFVPGKLDKLKDDDLDKIAMKCINETSKNVDKFLMKELEQRGAFENAAKADIPINNPISQTKNTTSADTLQTEATDTNTPKVENTMTYKEEINVNYSKSAANNEEVNSETVEPADITKAPEDGKMIKDNSYRCDWQEGRILPQHGNTRSETWRAQDFFPQAPVPYTNTTYKEDSEAETRRISEQSNASDVTPNELLNKLQDVKRSTKADSGIVDGPSPQKKQELNGVTTLNVPKIDEENNTLSVSSLKHTPSNIELNSVKRRRLANIKKARAVYNSTNISPIDFKVRKDNLQILRNCLISRHNILNGDKIKSRIEFIGYNNETVPKIKEQEMSNNEHSSTLHIADSSHEPQATIRPEDILKNNNNATLNYDILDANKQLRETAEKITETSDKLHATSEQLETTSKHLLATSQQLQATNLILHSTANETLLSKEFGKIKDDIQSLDISLNTVKDKIKATNDTIEKTSRTLDKINENIQSKNQYLEHGALSWKTYNKEDDNIQTSEGFITGPQIATDVFGSTSSNDTFNAMDKIKDLYERQQKEKPNKTAENEETPNISETPNTTLATSVAMPSQMTQVKPLPKLDDKLKLSELLQLVRERNRLLNCPVYEIPKNKEETVGAARKNIPPLSQPMQNQPANKQPLYAPMPPFPRVCPPLKKPKSKNTKCVQCDLRTLGLEQRLGSCLAGRTSRNYPGTSAMSQEPESITITSDVPNTADLSEDIILHLQTVGNLIKTAYNRYKMEALEAAIITKSFRATKMNRSKDYESWNAIPSWPYDKSQKRPKVQCPKEVHNEDSPILRRTFYRTEWTKPKCTHKPYVDKQPKQEIQENKVTSTETLKEIRHKIIIKRFVPEKTNPIIFNNTIHVKADSHLERLLAPTMASISYIIVRNYASQSKEDDTFWRPTSKIPVTQDDLKQFNNKDAKYLLLNFDSLPKHPNVGGEVERKDTKRIKYQDKNSGH